MSHVRTILSTVATGIRAGGALGSGPVDAAATVAATLLDGIATLLGGNTAEEVRQMLLALSRDPAARASLLGLRSDVAEALADRDDAPTPTDP